MKPIGFGLMPRAPSGIEADEWRAEVGVAVVELALDHPGLPSPSGGPGHK